MKTITLFTKPIPVNQKYMKSRSGRLILTSKYRDTKEAMKWEIKSIWGSSEPLRGSVTLNLLFYYGDNRKRDIDAYIKIVLDALSEIVYEDDSQIDEMHIFKLKDKEEPRTVIQVVE